MAFSILYVTREDHPSFRVDLAVLFGRALPRLGITSTLVAQRNGNPESPWPGGQAVTVPASKGLFSRHVGGLLHGVRSVAKLAKDHDAVQVRNKIVTGLVALVLARRACRPFFYWMTFPFPQDDLLRARIQGLTLGPLRLALTFVRGHATRWLLERLLLPHCDHVFVQSERMKQDLMAVGLSAEKMTPVPMGVDMDAMDALQPAPQALPFEPQARVLVYLGACDRSRGIEFLLDVLERVRAQQPQAVLLVVGDAAEAADHEHLQTLIRSRSLEEAVHVTGWLPREQALGLARASEVGVCALPADFIFDSMSPTKAVELMALGLPVVVTEHPDQGTLVRAGGGGFCTDYDPRAFAQAVLSLLDDPDMARAMGEQGREYAREHRSYSHLAEALAAQYGKLASEYARGQES
ncbi:glycosyltransferase family 4 protein [Desulfovibrio ferrophilus]|uniref:Glycosyl transferase group 1 n=1 Tax=Desulfovibrio ferrophilus TaxID=241368 RepID=A0A2Z6B1J7_9BACT|nr:glycosyltransferase family 4 protein [Desulfovibrio ferrophilus]BBD09266.1 glycosyl transferase group 1 [Desulfovibrio ferrophilus]